MKRIKSVLHKRLINGFEQYFTVKTDDEKKPILLFLHGGPGGANIGLASVMDRKTMLTEHFTVVQYDQRGAGKSYNDRMTKVDLSVSELIADVKCLIDELLSMFNQEKLVIVGHSFGTILGLRLCKEIQDKIMAYVGISQLVHVYESEKESTVEAFKICHETGKKKFIPLIEEGQQCFEQGDYAGYIMSQRLALIKMGGFTHNRKPMNPNMLYWVSGLSPHYKFKDTKNIKKGMMLSTEAMWQEIMTINFFDEIHELSVPVCFISGTSDIVAFPHYVKDYVELLDAPKKEFHLFQSSGHTPHIEEKDMYEKIVIKFYNSIKK